MSKDYFFFNALPVGKGVPGDQGVRLRPGGGFFCQAERTRVIKVTHPGEGIGDKPKALPGGERRGPGRRALSIHLFKKVAVVVAP